MRFIISLFCLPTYPICSLIDQTTPSAVLGVLHQQHGKGGSGDSGPVFVTRRNAYSWEMHTTAYSVVTSVWGGGGSVSAQAAWQSYTCRR